MNLRETYVKRWLLDVSQEESLNKLLIIDYRNELKLNV